MNMSIKNLVLLALMLVSAGLGAVLRPTQLLADTREKVDLEAMIPARFGDWRVLPQSSGQIINPQQVELLNKLYSQTLSRTYINSAGTGIMLSIAYGISQSDGVALHYPEVCYPSQGFQLISNKPFLLTTAYGDILGRQLVTRLGNRREPVTYWATLGDKVVSGGMKTKLAQLDYGFNGFIPDGLVFRVSSIDGDASKGHAEQAAFVQDLVSALPATSRLRLAGLAR